MISNDYQVFDMDSRGLTKVGPSMTAKLQNLTDGGIEWNGSLLDVGCDHAFFCFHAHFAGADPVVGLDRGRPVKGVQTDLVKKNRFAAERFGLEGVEFLPIELGRQWHMYGLFDNVLCQSMYHHVYNLCQDHEPIWYWLVSHTRRALWWEGVLNNTDPVVRMNVHGDYRHQDIMGVASRYFDGECVAQSPIPGRELWRMTPKCVEQPKVRAMVRSGAGGATGAFEYANNRRVAEIEDVLGFTPVPGSLNLVAPQPFNWDSRYLRAQILDVVDRKRGLFGPWEPRWCRFYPLYINGQQAYAMRFEGERYDPWFVELISYIRLRGILNLKDGDFACLQQC